MNAIVNKVIDSIGTDKLGEIVKSAISNKKGIGDSDGLMKKRKKTVIEEVFDNPEKFKLEVTIDNGEIVARIMKK